jgi:hypothetical protein
MAAVLDKWSRGKETARKWQVGRCRIASPQSAGTRVTQVCHRPPARQFSHAQKQQPNSDLIGYGQGRHKQTARFADHSGQAAGGRES